MCEFSVMTHHNVLLVHEIAWLNLILGFKFRVVTHYNVPVVSDVSWLRTDLD